MQPNTNTVATWLKINATGSIDDATAKHDMKYHQHEETITTSYARDSQFKPSCGNWNL